jgi:hypothetical protein
MNVIRKAHRNSLFLWLLAITVGLRALIAPGFMLETGGDGPLGLSIVLCEGLNGKTPASPSDDLHAIHNHHDNAVSEENASTGMAGETCGLWSTSSTFVQTIAFAHGHLFPVGPDQYVTVSSTFNAPLFRQQPQQPRAPPVTHLI